MKTYPVPLPDRIDLGCGPVHKQGFLRVDYDKRVNPDFCINLEDSYWHQLPNDYFSEIYCSHVIEHLTDTTVFLSEVIRIAKNSARFRFEFPHYSVSFIEPGHRRGYGLHALGLFPEFKVEKARLEWSPNRKGKNQLYYAADKIITGLANINPYITERIFCYWVGGFSNVILEGRIEKLF